MAFELSGVPSDRLPGVLATGSTDVRRIFLSMSAREQQGRDSEYLHWHSLDHRPEQYRIAGLRHSLRLVSTPSCREARAFSDPRYDAIDHVMSYFFAGGAALDQYKALSDALQGDRRPFRLPSVMSGYFTLAGRVAAPRAIAGADVIPWRPCRGAYLLVERGAESPAYLADLAGVAGIWWYETDTANIIVGSNNAGLQFTQFFLDGDPLAAAQQLRPLLEHRWAAQKVAPLFAAPFYTLVPFEWDRHLP